MDLNNHSEVTVGTYFKQWWQSLPPSRRKKMSGVLLLLAVFWVAGAIQAPTAVAGLSRITGPFRLLMSLGFGGFSFVWRGLKSSGMLSDTVDAPNLLWLPLALLVPGAVALFFYVLSQPPNPLYGIQKMLEQASSAQGRMALDAVKNKLAIRDGIPLTQIVDGNETVLLGLDSQTAEGHVMVVAPTRAGKGLHLTDTLLHYQGPALVVDPKGEQFQRTAVWRSRLGPIYRIPGHQLHLSAYYRHLRDRDEVIELHAHLLRPWASSEPIFAEKALSLFTAVGLYAQTKRLNPIRVLLDLAESNPVQSLAALRTVETARRHVDIFTNGAAPNAYQDDKFVTSALGNFTTRMAPYQKHVDTIAPPDLHRREQIIPPDWVSQNATIYITYNLNDLQAVGGVVAATIAAILRYQIRHSSKQKMLVAIDELPSVGLRNMANYLSTCGGYGITLLLYVQSVAQLHEIYGREGVRAILANCDHQVWYPAAEIETAKLMSELYGTTMKASPMQSASRSARQQQDKDGKAQLQTSNNQGASWSWREGAALSPNEMVALPKGQVLVTTLADQRYIFLGQRLNPIHLFDQLPPPDRLHLPQPSYRPRRYTDWLVAPSPTQFTNNPSTRTAGPQSTEKMR